MSEPEATDRRVFEPHGGSLQVQWKADGQRYELCVDMNDPRNAAAMTELTSKFQGKPFEPYDYRVTPLIYRTERSTTSLTVTDIGHWTLNVRDDNRRMRWARGLLGLAP